MGISCGIEGRVRESISLHAVPQNIRHDGVAKMQNAKREILRHIIHVRGNHDAESLDLFVVFHLIFVFVFTCGGARRSTSGIFSS